MTSMERAASGERDFLGWKGGMYRMSRATPVWVDNPGESTRTAVVGVREYLGAVLLCTSRLD